MCQNDNYSLFALMSEAGLQSTHVQFRHTRSHIFFKALMLNVWHEKFVLSKLFRGLKPRPVKGKLTAILNMYVRISWRADKDCLRIAPTDTHRKV